MCTKVGRYLTPADSSGINRGAFKGGLNLAPNLDYTYDGVMKSFEQSLNRLNLSKIDVCLIHDVDKWTHGEDVEIHFKSARSVFGSAAFSNVAYLSILNIFSTKKINLVTSGSNFFSTGSQFQV